MSSRGRRDALSQALRDALVAARLPRNATLIVAYSGGPDSTALLHGLVELAPEFGVSLLPAHLDHATRTSSEMDAAYCRRVAKRLGLPVLAERLVDPPRDEQGLRELRYRFLAEQAAMVGAAAVATGHTLDDQAETVLLHLVRGSGSAGLSGMGAATELQGIRVLRPMLGVSRQEVLAFLEARRIRFLEDPTNQEPIHDRNRVRREVLPVLESIRPGAARALARAAGILAEEAAYLEQRAVAALGRRSSPAGGLHRLPPAIGRLAVRELLKRGRGDLAGVTQAAIDDALALSLLSAADGKRRHLALPGPWVLVADGEGLQVLPGQRGKPSAARPEAASRARNAGRAPRKPLS